MTASQLKLATTLALDKSVDLSQENMDALDGFGLPDFTPVHVPLRAVARCLRWQCLMMNGEWDTRQYNEDRPHYLRNVEICDLTAPELREWLVKFATARLRGEALPLAA